MSYYCEKVSNLYGLSGEQIVECMKNVNEGNSSAEVKSWEISIPKLIDVVHKAGLDNLYMLTEYELPAGGRIDAILLGDDKLGKHHALIIELKQWSKDGVEYYGKRGFPAIKVKASIPYPSRHPVNQTKEYVDSLNSNHSNVVNGKLSVLGCQYLHNFELEAKNFFIQKEYEGTDISKMFVMGEENKFIDFLNSIFSKESNSEKAKDLFLKGEYVITKMDMEIINKVTESPDNIPLWHDQSKILDYIYPLLKKQAEGKLNTKHMLTISGAAGTGKTIIGFRILAEYWKLNKDKRKYSCTYTLPRSRTIKMVLDGLSKDKKGIKAVFLDNVKNPCDLLVVDEAHRINEFNKPLENSQIVIILQDDKQIVLKEEIGVESNFKKFAKENGYIYAKLELDYQKRSGLGSYVDRLDKLLYGVEYDNDNGLGIDVDVVDDIRDLEKWMEEKYLESKATKYYAPYCWEWKSRGNPNAIDISIPEENPVFKKQWNPLFDQYEWYEDSIDQVGCVYTAQGLGFDNVGLIWWDDLVWRNNEWQVNVEKIKDIQLKKSLKNDTGNKKLLLNVYRVMLTRAKKGFRIWFKDEETKKHFKKICLMKN